MCLLTVFPGGTLITDAHCERLTHGCERNSDGFGWAVATPERILTGHSLWAEGEIGKFQRVRNDHPDAPALFHSRMATAGTVTVDNVHPFPVGGDRMVMAHNGVLPVWFQPDKGDLRSDTRIMAEDFLPKSFAQAQEDWQLPGMALDSPAWRRRFRGILGGDKVAFLTIDPRYRKRLYVVNADKGHWKDGAWWSNSSYEPYVYVPTKWYFGPRPGDKGYEPYSPYGLPETERMALGDTTRWVSGRDGTVWVKDAARGYWRMTEERDTRDLPYQCKVCYTRGSVDASSGICAWCNCCDVCGDWVEGGDCATCWAPARKAITMGPKNDRQVEDMSEAEWEEYLAARMRG